MPLTKEMDPSSSAPCPKCSIDAEVAVVRIREHVPAPHAQDSFESVMQAIEEHLPQRYEACLFCETVATRFGQLYIVSPGCDDLAPERAFEGQRNGLCGGAVEGGLFVAVGMRAGAVSLSIDIRESAPHYPYGEHGDEIVEVSCTFFGPYAYVKGWGGEILGKFPLPGGQYRAKYTASNFGEAPGRCKINPTKENYSLVLWPESPHPDAVVRRTAQAAAYWHKLMQKRHFPLETPPKPLRPVVAFDSHMHTCYGIFTVLSRNFYDLQPHDAMAGQANGICGGAVSGGLFLTVGLHTGQVKIAVEIHDHAPAIDQSWDEIVEAPCNFTSLPVCLYSWDGGGIALPLDDGGEYRARFCAKSFGKTDSLRPDGGETDECYRLFLWPEASRPDAVIKQTSAAYWHSAWRRSA